MRLRKFIKFLSFSETDRDDVTLGPHTRIDPALHCAKLGSYDSEEYPTDSDLYVITKVVHPRAVKQWLGIEPVVEHPRVEGTIVTSLGFRLTDGTNQYRWNGSAWVVAVSGWNSEIEISNHIATFPVTSRRLGVVINLKTTDSSVTPMLRGVKVLFAAKLDSEIEDAIERSLVPMLRGVRAVTRLALTKEGSDNEIDMSSYNVDADYRFVGVDSVFNHTDDPNHDTDLLEGITTRTTTDPWTNGTVDTITLSALVNDGKQIWLEMLYEPVVAVETSVDWYQTARVPALVIESVAFSGGEGAGVDYVGNKDLGTAICVPAPLQGRLDITIAGISDKLIDHERLSAEVSRVLESERLLVVTGLDESYTITVMADYDFRSSPNENDLHTWRKNIRVENFRVWNRPEFVEYLVQDFVLDGDVELEVTNGN